MMVSAASVPSVKFARPGEARGGTCPERNAGYFRPSACWLHHCQQDSQYFGYGKRMANILHLSFPASCTREGCIKSPRRFCSCEHQAASWFGMCDACPEPPRAVGAVVFWTSSLSVVSPKRDPVDMGWLARGTTEQLRIPRRPMTAEPVGLRTNRRAAGPWAPLFAGLAAGAEASLCTWQQASGNGAHQQMGQISNCSVPWVLCGVYIFAHFHPSILQLPRNLMLYFAKTDFCPLALPHTAFVILSAELSFFLSSVVS